MRTALATIEDEDTIAVTTLPLPAQRADVKRRTADPTLLRLLPKPDDDQHNHNPDTDTICAHLSPALVIWLDSHHLLPDTVSSLTTCLPLADIDIDQLELGHKMSAKITEYNI
jgi:hypothetical protein